MSLNRKTLSLLIAICFGPVGIANAADYVDMNFESGTEPPTGTPLSSDPNAWTLPPSFADNYGKGNHFEVTNSSSHSGDYSLRFTYQGRNGFCNTCGTKKFTHSSAPEHDGASYFVSKNESDLTSINSAGTSDGKGPAAAKGKLVYNKTAGYSLWEITGIASEDAENDRANLKLIKGGIGGEPAVFNNLDVASFARQCGIDGVIGKTGGNFDITRRSDCDNVVTWFAGITAGIQPSGSSIFRRVYLKSELNGAPKGQKLNYARLHRGGTDPRVIILSAGTTSAATGETVPRLGGFGLIGGQRLIPGQGIYEPGNGLPVDLKFERGVWYYIEQEYKSETYIMTTSIDNGKVVVDSYAGNGDGEYRLWIAKSGDPVSQGAPVLDLIGFALPPILGGTGTHMSLWGNASHHLHSYGSWYMDDIKISDSYNGPVSGATGKNIAPPKSATVN